MVVSELSSMFLSHMQNRVKVTCFVLYLMFAFCVCISCHPKITFWPLTRCYGNRLIFIVGSLHTKRLYSQQLWKWFVRGQLLVKFVALVERSIVGVPFIFTTQQNFGLFFGFWSVWIRAHPLINEWKRREKIKHDLLNMMMDGKWWMVSHTKLPCQNYQAFLSMSCGPYLLHIYLQQEF
jgi:hypothetical protein